MTPVSRKTGFRYGFYVFAYWLVLLAVGAALVAAGWLLIQEPGRVDAVPENAVRALGGFVAFLGVLVFGAGQTGLVYKVVADAVETGIVARGAGRELSSASATDEREQPTTGETQPRQPESSTVEPPTGGPAGVPGESGPGPTAEPVADDGPSVGAETADEPGQEPEPVSGPEPASTATDAEPTTASSVGPETDPGTGDPTDESDVRTAGESGVDASSGDGEFEAAEFEPPRPADETDTASRGSETQVGQDESTAGSTEDSHPEGEGEAEGEADETPAGGETGDSPADVASESGIAEELGFDGDENGDDAGTADGDEPDDDPLAPDSDFTPGEQGPDRTTDESTVPLTDDAAAEETRGGDATARDVDMSTLFGGTESTGESVPTDAETGGTSDDDPLMAVDDDSADGGEERDTDTPDGRDDTDETGDETQTWTTGEGHMGEPDEQDEREG